MPSNRPAVACTSTVCAADRRPRFRRSPPMRDAVAHWDRGTAQRPYGRGERPRVSEAEFRGTARRSRPHRPGGRAGLPCPGPGPPPAGERGADGAGAAPGAGEPGGPAEGRAPAADDPAGTRRPRGFPPHAGGGGDGAGTRLPLDRVGRGHLQRGAPDDADGHGRRDRGRAPPWASRRTWAVLPCSPAPAPCSATGGTWRPAAASSSSTRSTPARTPAVFPSASSRRSRSSYDLPLV